MALFYVPLLQLVLKPWGLLYDVANTLQNVFASVVQGLTILIVGL